MKKLILLLIIGIFLFGCTEKEEIPIIEMGDIAFVDYITYLENGSIIDTSIEEIAVENNIFNSNRDYSPIEVQLLDNNGYIKGLTHGLLGLENGSNETLIISPEMAYGKANESEIFKTPKYFTFELIEELNKSNFEKEYKLNETFKEQNWNITVINITNSTYIFEHHPKINTTFITMGIPKFIYDLNKTHAFVETQLELGSKHYFEHPKDHSLKTARITSIENDIITIDFNKELAGEIIIMDIWVRNITKRQ
ncbi:MAG: FKBP-type peptidyl-prolyl cis-trans isomerase [Candidatus Micrarchaeia archaeon]|jgi:FKBP-type peptidyl-prolyl cis-trans isomerase 2